MGHDVKLFRNQESLTKIINSEQIRGRTRENINQVLDIDLLWRESKRKLDEINSKINSNNSAIKKLWKSNQEFAKTISFQNQSLEDERKILEDEEKTLKSSLNKALNLIGNLISEEVPENNSNLLKKASVPINSTLKGELLLLKHRVFSEFLSFGQQHGYSILQTPSIVLQSLFLKVFPFKSCSTIPGKKPKTLIKSPLEAVLLSFYKENLSDSIKILAQGVFFSAKGKIKQSEKFSFISFCESQSLEESSYSILNDFEKALKIFAEDRKMIKRPRPSIRVSNSAIKQVDFFLSLDEEYLKIGTFSVIGDFLCRSGQIKIKGKEFAQVVCATFDYFF